LEILFQASIPVEEIVQKGRKFEGRVCPPGRAHFASELASAEGPAAVNHEGRHVTAAKSSQLFLDSAVELTVDVPTLGTLENLFRTRTPDRGEALHANLNRFNGQGGPMNRNFTLHCVQLVFQDPADDTAIVTLFLDTDSLGPGILKHETS
jgi:hypothetical protein